MLKIHSCGRAGEKSREIDPASGELPDGVAWIDVFRPDEADAAFLKRTTGLTLPDLGQLSEVESSSRLRRADKALYLSLPLVFGRGVGNARMTPVGIVLAKNRLVTIRFETLPSFEIFGKRLAAGEISHPTTVGIFVALLETVVDRLADILEEIGTDLDEVVTFVFGQNDDPVDSARQKKEEGLRLRSVLRQVGRDRQLISKVRGTLLGIDRIVPYVLGEGEDWLPEEAKPRLETVRQDIASLDEFEVHLSDKVQFLLDAALGLINIEQNDTFRILTIASVVGIPPTLVASMYGMNFKHMPELDWLYGYPYGLAVIALSAIAPLVYFRRKGWF